MSDVTVGVAPLRSIAGITAFRDQSVLCEALRREFWLSVPPSAGFVQSGTLRLCRLGPSRYVMSGDRQAGLSGRLSHLLDGLAAITDQSDLWTCFDLDGARVAELLSRVVPVDLRAKKFAPGRLALTRAGHLDVRVFRTGALHFEIAVARSYAEDLRHLLDMANHG